MAKQKKSTELKFRPASGDLPATQRMLQLVRSELKADIRGLRSETRAGFNQTDSKLEQVLSEVARVGTLVEEQNSNNRIVLEGLTGLYQRQDRNEMRTEEIQNLVYGLAARSRR